jgi:putative transposase
LIAEDKQDRLNAYLFGIAKNLGIEILAVGGTQNHVHILMALPSAKMLSHAIRDLKANSSRWMRENDQKFSWQEGFGAFSVSPSQAPMVKAYIRNQAAHHRKRNFEEEFLALLTKSGISYDSKYVFG